MTLADRLELIEKARADVASVVALLESPTTAALDRSAAELSTAIGRIEQLQNQGSGGGFPVKSALTGLRNDLRRASTLLRHAWELRAGRGGQVGYTRKGESEPPPLQTVRWTLKG